MKYFEAIATSITDVKDLQKVAVDSIELCGDIDAGGRTPDYQLIKEATEISQKPIHVMVRHRTDFLYDEADYNQLIKDILFIRQTKAAAIVIGLLNADHSINVEKMREICLNAFPLKVVFHKAFDETPDLKAALVTLVELGISTVLTQGGHHPIAKNIPMLQEMVAMQLPIRILLGGGIDQANFPALAQAFDNLHVNRLIRQNQDDHMPIDIDQAKTYLALLHGEEA